MPSLDRLRCEQAMNTDGRENPNHRVTWPRNRAHGAVGQNRSRSIKWAEKQEKFQPKEMCFFLTSTFIVRTYRDFARDRDVNPVRSNGILGRIAPAFSPDISETGFPGVR